jgi:hypothetical protein
MTEHEAKMLALLDQGEKDAAVALDDLKALWAREDEITAANRAAVLEAHERGARDRAEARKQYEPAPEEKPKRPRRTSELSVTPLAALDQTDGK